MKSLPLLSALLLALPAAPAPQAEVSAFERALASARRSLEAGTAVPARDLVIGALERDPRSVAAWTLRARVAEALGDRDEQVWALHEALSLAAAQELPEAELAALREAVLAADSIAPDLFGLRALFIDRLRPIAEAYEEADRPHSAIRVHKEILALDAENAGSLAAIERLSSRPDPSLAADAKPVDLLEGVSQEWIRAHDERTLDWQDRAVDKGEYYVTHTNAGYEVLVRAAAAMDQMNAFYREFFTFDGTSPRIDLRIFRTRDEYLKLGQSPAEWSGGQFTGGAVETYITTGGFEDSVGTLFHEAAHQFVSLATNASGWLNEGLASFFEGCRMLPNGTVLMNLPAMHRLEPLVRRMKVGWMSSHEDGTSADQPTRTPSKAPTFRIVLENKYTWGPPWYAPTWGVVYFLYNYQDPVDGRFIYRRAFRQFIDKSGGRVGEGAIKNFEEIVLGNPEPPVGGVERPDDVEPVPLPKTVDELTEVWKDWLLRLYDEESGLLETTRPYHRWATFAVAAENDGAAFEHFEKALVQTPDDVVLLEDFANFLADRRADQDRASKLLGRALRLVESAEEPDEKRIRQYEKQLAKWDPERKTLDEVHERLWAAARGLVQRYQAAEMPMMVMEVCRRLGTELGVPGLYDIYGEAVRASGKSLDLWQLAYNESDLRGWNATSDTAFRPQGIFLEAGFRGYVEDEFDYSSLLYDTVVSGDFSLELELEASRGEASFAGVVFGRKSLNSFHAVLLFPGRMQSGEAANTGFVDLATFFGPSDFKTWRHVPVDTTPKDQVSSAGDWHTLRLDVAGTLVDLWFDGEFVATHEFANRDLLRGSLGLLIGPGKARFRDVRYLARPPDDPAAEIERGVRMESIRAEGGGAVGGSWLGQVPPWPDVGKWVQEPREAWGEGPAGPQLLVLWSIQQNDLIPIHDWLEELAHEYRDVGLRFVCVASPNDREALADYVQDNPFPGSVGADDRDGAGIGNTFETYFVARFNLPRILLLDVDGKVAWEGDPGFKIGDGWYPGVGSYLDDPLKELIEKRRLRELMPWREDWEEIALPALRAGDVAAARPYLEQARGFQRGLVPEVDDAHRKLGALEGALGAVETTAASFEREQAEPALEVLLDWAPLFDREIDGKTVKALRPLRTGDHADDWQDALKLVERYQKRAKPGKELDQARELLAGLEGLEGRFPARLAEDLKAAVDAEDVEAVNELAATAAQRPARWLISEYFDW